MKKSFALSIFLMMIVLSACTSPIPASTPTLESTFTPKPTITPTLTITPTATVTPVPTPLGGGIPRIAIMDGFWVSGIRIGTITDNQIILSDITLSVEDATDHSKINHSGQDPIRWSPNGRYLAYINYKYLTSADPRVFIAIYDFQENRILWDILAREKMWQKSVYEILWSADSSWVSVNIDDVYYIISIETGRVVSTIYQRSSGGQWDIQEPVFYYDNATKKFDPRTGKTDTIKSKVSPPKQFTDAESYSYGGGFISQEANGIINFSFNEDHSRSIFLNQNDNVKELLRIYFVEIDNFQDVRVLKSPDNSSYLIGAYGQPIARERLDRYFTYVYKVDGDVVIKKDAIINNIYPIKWSSDSKNYIGISAGENLPEYWLVFVNSNDNSVIQKVKLTIEPFVFVPAGLTLSKQYTGFDIFWEPKP